MKNIGPVSGQWLAAVGIHTLDDLKSVGVLNAYNLVKSHGYNANRNLLWALQGALLDVHWTRIPARTKQELLERLKENR